MRPDHLTAYGEYTPITVRAHTVIKPEPIAWESTTEVYERYITDSRYRKLRPSYQRWYRPYCCSRCASNRSFPPNLDKGQS